MKRATSALRKKARRLFLSGEMETNAEIAANLKVKPHTVGAWRREEGWDETRRKAEKNAAAKMAAAIASENVSTNITHYKIWGVLLKKLIGTLDDTDPETVRVLERQAAVAERAQRGQRVARGLSADGQTEERIRAEAQADYRSLVDAVVEAVQLHVSDEIVREKIADAVMGKFPRSIHDSENEGGEAA